MILSSIGPKKEVSPSKTRQSDSRTQELKDSRTQLVKNSTTQELNSSRRKKDHHQEPDRRARGSQREKLKSLRPRIEITRAGISLRLYLILRGKRLRQFKDKDRIHKGTEILYLVNSFVEGSA